MERVGHLARSSAVRRASAFAAGVAGLVVLGACSSGSEGSLPLRTVPTTVVETTTTTAGPATSTTPAPLTPAPSRTPVIVNGVPQAKASPTRGAIGTRVQLDGYGFTEAHWKAADASLWLSGSQSGCALYASAQHSVRVTADGHLSGDFTVPGRGECRQSDVADAAVGNGSYTIVFQCTACSIGTFEVTGSGPPASAQCKTVGFTPQSEDAASSIVATGLSCDEAEAFVRRLGPSVGTNGPARIELDGYQCVHVRYQDEPLPQGFYECTSGSKRITFVRS